MKFVIMKETLDRGDALRGDLEGVYRSLADRHDVVFYFENGDSDPFSPIPKEDLEKSIQDPDLCLIYYHCDAWEYGREILQKAGCGICVRYDGIRRAELNRPYSSEWAIRRQKDLEAVRAMERELSGAFWLCTSKYAAEGLSVPEDRKGVCPLFNRIQAWGDLIPDEALLQKLSDSKGVNLLLAGSFLTGGGHLKAVRAVQQYCLSYDRRITLRMAGRGIAAQTHYLDYLRKTAEENGLSEQVQLIEKVSDEELLSLYLGSDLLLGYGGSADDDLSVLEAQFLELPVIAARKGEIPELLGENRICLEDGARLTAAAIRYLTEHRELTEDLRKHGRMNYQNRFSETAVRGIFLEELQRSLKRA